MFFSPAVNNINDVCRTVWPPPYSRVVSESWSKWVSESTSESHILSSGVHNLYSPPFIHNINCMQGSLTALHHAAYGGSVECVKYLLPRFGDKKFEVDEDGLTCLHWAILGSSLPVVRYLVDQWGFDLRSRTAVSYGMVHDSVCTPVRGCLVRHDACHC